MAGVLALAPKVIILDEPTTGLDYGEQRDLLDLVAELHAQGCTIIMVTHSMWAAATYARRLVVLKDGEVVLDGPTREVLAQEEILSAARLRPPAVVQLSRRLGFLALSPEEFRERHPGTHSLSGSALPAWLVGFAQPAHQRRWLETCTLGMVRRTHPTKNALRVASPAGAS